MKMLCTYVYPDEKQNKSTNASEQVTQRCTLIIIYKKGKKIYDIMGCFCGILYVVCY